MESLADKSFWDEVALVLWNASPIIALAAVLWVALRGGKASIPQKILASLCIAGGLFAFLRIASFGIVMRDGLGPDSATSYGLEALQRSAPTLAFALIVGAILFALGYVLLTQEKRKKDAT